MSKNRLSSFLRRHIFLSADRSLGMLFLLNVGVSLSMESVAAFFPLYVQSLGASVLEVGLLLSGAGLFSTVLMLPSGWMSDRIGRKITLALSVVLASFPPLFYTGVTNWRQLIPWTMIFAASFAVFIPARMVYIADSTNSDGRAKMYGYMNLAWPVGSLIGPAAAGLLALRGGFSYPFYFAATVSAVSLLPALLLVERRSQKPRSEVHRKTVMADLAFPREAICPLIVLTAYQLLVSAGISTTYSLLSIYLSEVFGVDKLRIGIFYSIVAMSLFGSQIVGGWASSQFGLRKIMVICLAATLPLFIFCAFASTYEWFTLTYMALYGLYSMTWPASVTMLMGLVDKSKWGLATGIRQTGVRLGFTIGPTLGGFLWEAHARTTPFYASAILMAVSIIFLIMLREE